MTKFLKEFSVCFGLFSEIYGPQLLYCGICTENPVEANLPHWLIAHRKKMSTTSLIRPGLTTSIKKNLPLIKARLRAKVPQLTKDDIRKAHIIYYQALIMELYENGYPNSAALLEKLIEYERTFDIPKGLVVKSFTYSKNILDKFANGIRPIELAKRNGNAKLAIDLFLELAHDFAQLHHDLYWLAEQLFYLTVNEVTENNELENQLLIETRIRYYFGCFYLDKMSNYEQAVEQFGTAIALCRGHESEWTISEENFNYLSKEVSRKYFDALNTAAKCLIKIDSEKAAKFAELSIKVALSADIPQGIAECYLEYGKILWYRKQNEQAIEAFSEAQSYGQIAGRSDTIAESYFFLAQVYKAQNQLAACEKNLKLMKRVIDKNDLVDLLAKYYEIQGDFLLESGEGVQAAEQYVHAIEEYSRMGHHSEIRHARFRASIAIAKEIESTFVETLLKCDKEPFGNNKYLTRLLEWKSNRTPFWDYSDDNRITVSTTDTTFEYLGDDIPKEEEVCAEVSKVRLPPDNTKGGVYLNSIVEQINEIRERTNFVLLQKIINDEKQRQPRNSRKSNNSKFGRTSFPHRSSKK